MTEVLVKDKDIVAPGDVLAKGMESFPGNGTYREGDNIMAARLGLVQIQGRTIKLIPLSGRYLPKVGDTIIAKVISVDMNSWRFDTNSPYPAMLPLKEASSRYIERGEDLRQYFDLGEYAVVKITQVSSQKLIDLSAKGPGLRKLKGGRVIQVASNKVPRIIGKQGSMVSMLKEQTGCNITVGQNGLAWIDGTPEAEQLAIKAIRKIEKESHLSGLTERMKTFLTENKK